MPSFLQEVIDQITEAHDSLEHFVFVLPSKRAGTYLKNTLAKKAQSTAFAPEIVSIEGFIENISGLSYLSNTQLLFELYSTYLDTVPSEKDTFFVFSKWGQTLLQDFNEIDRYLVDAEKLFSNLSAIQEINHWSVRAEKTTMIQNYLSFWNNLYQLYTAFNARLLQQGCGHQGLVYRQACERLPEYLNSAREKTHVFIGFNALNSAESQIVQSILDHSNADIFWDIDAHFINDEVHDAGLFIRQHRKTWPYFKHTPLKEISGHFTAPKNIQIVGVPKNIAQAKYVGDLLAEIKKNQVGQLDSAAVILGDENLLNPILNAVPEEIDAVNITMGYPLSKTPPASLFDDFMRLYSHTDPSGWFYRDVLTVLSHPYINAHLQADSNIQTTIRTKNWTHISPNRLAPLIADQPLLQLLFFEGPYTPLKLLKNCLAILQELKAGMGVGSNSLALEYLYRFHTLFNQLYDLVQRHAFISDLNSLHGLYKELLSSETVDFQGDPIQGLQIMGMLESRNLDFETVIITSVNEGILPSGKSNNSFIPFDLKTALGLPTYKEKDAVYTYHFYRLLQRAKNVYILYNTEADVLEGGEKSRLIAQLMTDPALEGRIVEKIAAPAIVPVTQALQTLEKDDGLMQLIRQHAQNGFSPTSLSNYIRNPIDFYKRNLLGIDDTQQVEETIAANTFGTIVHDTLEALYTPFIGNVLTADALKQAKAKIADQVKRQFAKSYQDGDITRGKNLIAYRVIVRYIENYIDSEIKAVSQHHIKILGIEQKLHLVLAIPEIDFKVVLKGKLDRIDERDGMLRIIDYKTGKVESKDVEIINWQAISADYAYNKAFQLLCYALMYHASNPVEAIQSGIVSFKNLNAGLLKFATKDRKGSYAKKDTTITHETLSYFEDELKKLILEICDPDLPLIEKII